jgi:signal transduction histidine kinase
MKKVVPKDSKITETVSIVAHHLKSPLSVIKGYIEALISGDCGEINPLQKEYLSDALENIEKMKEHINDLLIIQKLEEGKFRIDPKSVSLEKITSDVLDNLSLWAKALNCQIVFEKPKKLPSIVIDPRAIKQVIENLISNGIKYTKGKGKVEISIKQKGKDIIFSCKDNGIGIPKKDFDKVFTRFYRSEEAIELDPSGAGLGLFINKSIIELSNGKIWFSRNKGSGMTFYFSLPIAR